MYSFNEIEKIKTVEFMLWLSCLLITHSNINIDVAIKYYVNYASLFQV